MQQFTCGLFNHKLSLLLCPMGRGCHELWENTLPRLPTTRHVTISICIQLSLSAEAERREKLFHRYVDT